jgi:methionyl-tRNA formyltransferase
MNGNGNRVLQIIFFTNRSSCGVEILRQLKKNNIIIRAIFIESPKPRGYLLKINKSIKQSGFIETIKEIFNQLKIILIPAKENNWFSKDFYRSYSNETYIVDDFNGEQCASLLRQLNPDVIVLGGSRIIRKNIISIPKIGILNAHPGLLPKYRGVDVIPWAVYNGDEVGVTVHFIDEGVDTGRIIMQEVIKLDEKETISTLRNKSEIISLIPENL